MSGEVLYNGKKLNKRAKRQVGFVMQDDLLYESLTVYETVRLSPTPLAALLCKQVYSMDPPLDVICVPTSKSPK